MSLVITPPVLLIRDEILSSTISHSEWRLQTNRIIATERSSRRLPFTLYAVLHHVPSYHLRRLISQHKKFTSRTQLHQPSARQPRIG